MKKFDLILVDTNKEICNEWKTSFAREPQVKIVNGKFESLPKYDCLVSAANSYGLMDGGIDLAITKYFGIQLMERVQEYIIKNFKGEQPVGTSFIIETNNKDYPYLAHTPTMRVPMRISRTDNAYNAMKAMCLAVSDFNEQNNGVINSVACCGLGTLTGGVAPEEAARQMSLAWRNFFNPPSKISWAFARSQQKALGRGGDHY